MAGTQAHSKVPAASSINEAVGGKRYLGPRRRLYSWGANTSGQLGLNNWEDTPFPSEVSIPDSGLWQNVNKHCTCIKNVQGGGGFSVTLSDCGCVFTCGNNSRGQLGNGDKENVACFILCEKLLGVRVKQVAAGWDFVITVTDSGTSLSWGSNSFGQLGRELTSGSYDPNPGLVQADGSDPFCLVTAGMRHCLALTGKKRLYAWGHNKKGQLGSTQDESNLSPKVPLPVEVCLEDSKQVSTIVAGMYHSGCLTETGLVYMWGCNKHGQCARDPAATGLVSVPAAVSLLSGQPCRFTSMASGWTHVLVTTDKGSVYSWGRADLGQLGRLSPGVKLDHVPSLVQGLPPVKVIACGSEHNLALADSGEVYVWGWNEHSVCGTGDELNVHFPQKLSSLAGERIVDIGSGCGHSFCVLANDSNENG